MKDKENSKALLQSNMPSPQIASKYTQALQHHFAGQLTQAEVLYRQVLEQQSDHPESLQMLGVLCDQTGRLQEALRLIRRSIELCPERAQYRSNLGMVLAKVGLWDESISTLRQVIATQSDLPEAHTNLGNALLHTGQLDEAITSFRRSLSLRPDSRIASKRLVILHCHPDYDSRRLYEEHTRWNETYARPLASSIMPHENDRAAERPLRIGYVSPQLAQNPVGRFLLPLLGNHNRSEYEIFCYTDTPASDLGAAPLVAAANHWRDISGVPDEQLAAIIRDDRIDILIDLVMHSEGNRLLAFARKPAPVQVTWLSYCSTTGLETMDYRITDPYLDLLPIDDCRLPNEKIGNRQSAIGNNRDVPFIASDPSYSEQSLWLPHTYWCYPEHANVPDVVPPPALGRGHVTFGCFNSFIKLTVSALRAWGRILHDVPRSQLLVHAGEGLPREHVRRHVSAEGVESDRIQFVGALPLPEYFRLYHQIDIALDPFPFPGGTTTCDALWMGVPVVSLAGKTAVSRAGRSILSNIGLGDLVADGTEAYVKMAVELASDVPRLASLRATMRQRMQKSPLMDAVSFARNIESAYRTTWRRWCASAPS